MCVLWGESQVVMEALIYTPHGSKPPGCRTGLLRDCQMSTIFMAIIGKVFSKVAKLCDVRGRK